MCFSKLVACVILAAHTNADNESARITICTLNLCNQHCPLYSGTGSSHILTYPLHSSDLPPNFAMASSSPPQWPPEISDQQREQLTLLATTYALSHGLIYLPPANVQPPAPTSAIHAPLALFPSPFPREQFELAKRLQREYNVLYARVAMDEEFLDRVMGAERGVGRVDEFTGQLWRIWKSLRDQGVQQVRDHVLDVKPSWRVQSCSLAT